MIIVGTCPVALGYEDHYFMLVCGYLAKLLLLQRITYYRDQIISESHKQDDYQNIKVPVAAQIWPDLFIFDFFFLLMASKFQVLEMV